ncbi:MAG: hypothetical protein GX625_03055 [Clostridiaceae bacterium]|nr:hypothetical protein [Clostridiaceae bacterium]
MPTIINGFLHVTAEENEPVEITEFNIRGQVVSMVKSSIKTGDHMVRLPQKSSGVHVYKIKIGSSEYVIKGTFYGNENRTGSMQASRSKDLVLSRQAEKKSILDDVIAVTKEGYLNYRMAMTNPDTSGLDIQMIVCEGTVTDIDGNVYQTVRIGNQVWSVENLRTTKLNDGTPLVMLKNPDDTFPAYCFYNYTTNEDSIKLFGALYNWYSVDSKKLAPTGCHVPSRAEWDTLQNYLILNGYNYDGSLTGNKFAKALAAKAYWKVDTNYIGTIGNELAKNNRTGFFGMPGGRSLGFSEIGIFAYWWTSSINDVSYAYMRRTSTVDFLLKDYIFPKRSGLSVKFVHD